MYHRYILLLQLASYIVTINTAVGIDSCFSYEIADLEEYVSRLNSANAREMLDMKYDELEDKIPFGKLPVDWKRLWYLADTLPADVDLKKHFLVVYKFLIVAYERSLIATNKTSNKSRVELEDTYSKSKEFRQRKEERVVNIEDLSTTSPKYKSFGLVDDNGSNNTIYESSSDSEDPEKSASINESRTTIPSDVWTTYDAVSRSNEVNGKLDDTTRVSDVTTITTNHARLHRSTDDTANQSTESSSNGSPLYLPNSGIWKESETTIPSSTSNEWLESFISNKINIVPDEATVLDDSSSGHTPFPIHEKIIENLTPLKFHGQGVISTVSNEKNGNKSDGTGDRSADIAGMEKRTHGSSETPVYSTDIFSISDTRHGNGDNHITTSPSHDLNPVKTTVGPLCSSTLCYSESSRDSYSANTANNAEVTENRKHTMTTTVKSPLGGRETNRPDHEKSFEQIHDTPKTQVDDENKHVTTKDGSDTNPTNHVMKIYSRKKWNAFKDAGRMSISKMENDVDSPEEISNGDDTTRNNDVFGYETGSTLMGTPNQRSESPAFVRMTPIPKMDVLDAPRTNKLLDRYEFRKRAKVDTNLENLYRWFYRQGGVFVGPSQRRYRIGSDVPKIRCKIK